MKGTDQYAWAKIFRWDERTGLSLYAQRNTSFSSGSGGIWDGQSNYRLYSPQVSFDGSVVAFTAALDCTWGTPCATSVEKSQSTIRLGDGSSRNYTGSARLSSNGRYGVFYSSARSSPYGVRHWYRDLVTGDSLGIEPSGQAGSLQPMVADDGTVLRTKTPNGPLELFRPGFHPFRPTESTPVPADSTTNIQISADGRWLVWTSDDTIVRFERATGLRNTLRLPPQAVLTNVSNDASVLVLQYANPAPGGFPQLFLRKVTVITGLGGKPVDWELPGEISGVGTLSGNGQYLFVSIAKPLSLTRLNLVTGKMDEVARFPETGTLRANSDLNPRHDVAPGGLLRLVRSPQAPPLPRNLVGAKFGSSLWPILFSDENVILIQVPWSATPAGYRDLQLLLPDDPASPFYSLYVHVPWTVRETAPVLVPPPFALHEDYSGPITDAFPAKQGETIHVFGTGFGSVAGTPPLTAAPTPTDRLYPLAALPRCTVGTGFVGAPSVPAQVAFAGLAPGLTGVNQMDIRLPQSEASGRLRLICTVGRFGNLDGFFAAAP